MYLCNSTYLLILFFVLGTISLMLFARFFVFWFVFLDSFVVDFVWVCL